MACCTACLLFVAPASAAPPPNDSFSNATAAGNGVPGGATGTNVEATLEPGEPENPRDPGGHSVWFEWTANADGTVAIDTCGSNFDTILAVYTGNALNNLVPRGYSDDDGSCGGGTGRESEVRLGVTNGQVFSIQVDGFDGETGAIDLNVTESDPVVQVSPFVEVTETDAGGVNAIVDVTLSEPNVVPVAVDAETDSGNAVAPDDYTATSQPSRSLPSTSANRYRFRSRATTLASWTSSFTSTSSTLSDLPRSVSGTRPRS